ncbi:MAG: hypothetical protein FD136_1376, partial [Chitinophagaceae bacterium]
NEIIVEIFQQRRSKYVAKAIWSMLQKQYGVCCKSNMEYAANA